MKRHGLFPRGAALLLTSALIVGMAAGCSPASISTSSAPKDASGEASATGDGVTKIVYWSHFGGEDGAYMDTMLEQFKEANPDIEVEHLKVINENYYAKLKTGVVSGEGPDVATGDADRLKEFKVGGLIQNMAPYAEQAGVDWGSYTGNILEGCMLDGEQMAIPLSSYATIMFANKKLLEDAGMLRLNEKGTVDFGTGEKGFLDFLQAYNSKKPADVFTMVGSTASGDDVMRMFWSFYDQTGESLLSSDMKSAQMNSANGKKAMNLLAGLTETGILPRNMEDSDQIFKTNKAAFFVSGVWMVGSLAASPDLDFIAMPLPQIYEKPSAWGGTHVFMMPAKDGQTQAQKVAVARFADWMASNAGEWIKAGHVAAKPAIADSAEYKALTHRDTYLEVAEYIVAMPQHENLTAIVEVLKKNLPTGMNGQTTVDASLAACETEINAIIG